MVIFRGNHRQAQRRSSRSLPSLVVLHYQRGSDAHEEYPKDVRKSRSTIFSRVHVRLHALVAALFASIVHVARKFEVRTGLRMDAGRSEGQVVDKRRKGRGRLLVETRASVLRAHRTGNRDITRAHSRLLVMLRERPGRCLKEIQSDGGRSKTEEAKGKESPRSRLKLNQDKIGSIH